MLPRLRAALESALAVWCVLLMALLALLVIAGVTFRKLGAPFGWYDEVAGVLLAWITYYGAALAALKRGHLGFPNLVAAVPPALRVPLVLLREALVLAFFAAAAWYGWQVVDLLEGDMMVSLTWVPVSVTQSVVPIGALLFILAELLTVPERLAEASVGAAPPDPERQLAVHPR